MSEQPSSPPDPNVDKNGTYHGEQNGYPDSYNRLVLDGSNWFPPPAENMYGDTTCYDFEPGNPLNPKVIENNLNKREIHEKFFKPLLRNRNEIKPGPDLPGQRKSILVQHFTSKKRADEIMKSGIIEASSDTGHVEVMTIDATARDARNAGAKFTEMKIIMLVPEERISKSDPAFSKHPKALMFNTPGFQHIGGFSPIALPGE